MNFICINQSTYRWAVFIVTSFIGVMSMPGNAQASDFWSEDIWQRVDRPFLFYGESAKDEPSKSRNSFPDVKVPEAKTPIQRDESDDNKFSKALEEESLATLKRIETVEELKAEVKKRLEVAVMRPTAKTIGLYLQANAFLIDKAGVFAQKWRTHLMTLPQYDWTAQHPSVNAASTEMSRIKRQQTESDLSVMAKDWGYVLLGNDSALTDLMAGIVEDFARRFGFEIVTVSVTPDNPRLPQAKFDPKVAQSLTGGLSQFPALVLVHRSDTSPADARLIATGVVDGQELARRTAAFYPMSRPNDYERGWLRVGETIFEPR